MLRCKYLLGSNEFARKFCVRSLIALTIALLFVANYVLHHFRYQHNNFESNSQVVRYAGQAHPQGAYCEQPQLYTHARVVIFTTAVFNGSQVSRKWQNSQRCWAAMRPQVAPVLFIVPENMTDPETLSHACQAGWTVLKAPSWNKDGYPVLRDMFLEVERLVTGKPNIKWLGYANSDVLFDDTLLDSLNFLDCTLEATNYTNPLVTGRRRDMAEVPDMCLGPGQLQLLYLKAQLHVHLGIDYFFTRPRLFPWDHVPPFVIGRPHYDRYLMWLASTSADVFGVDATEAVRALHQGKPYAWKNITTSRNYNGDIIKQDFPKNVSDAIMYLSSATCIPFALKTSRARGRTLLKLVHRDELIYRRTSCVPQRLVNVGSETCTRP